MAKRKETSDRVSKDASELMQFRGGEFVWVGRRGVAIVTGRVRAVAASALSQDETKGQRRQSKFEVPTRKRVCRG